ncbi:MAG: hypothetical protein DRO94_03795 [Candidatus Altiarchaeales archaeon]|nr:MAG: hypothetical protein DRO95_03850 [Candidatus Altiarchaeales archaeon]RLI94055.1 MAG: hypothetical protein DRO94_03795 [Candidatus Altiarchaeales archaeon]
MMRTNSILIIFMIISVLGCINNSDKSEETTVAIEKPEIVARYGDIVEVNYIARLENGTIFDTTYEDVAESSGIYNPTRIYKPLRFRIGEGKVIRGFEMNIIGMRIHENKTFRVPPELGYGYWDPKKVIEIDKIQRSPRIINVSIDEFVRNLKQEPIINKTYLVNKSGWNVTVIKIRNDTVEIRQTPPVGSGVITPYGIGTVNLTEDYILIEINPKLGEKIKTEYGNARVIGIGRKKIRLDFNHELAGETLYFEVVLENITRLRGNETL